MAHDVLQSWAGFRLIVTLTLFWTDDPLLSGKPQHFFPNPQNKVGMLSCSSLNRRKYFGV